jgi:hypothetical protein
MEMTISFSLTSRKLHFPLHDYSFFIDILHHACTSTKEMYSQMSVGCEVSAAAAARHSLAAAHLGRRQPTLQVLSSCSRVKAREERKHDSVGFTDQWKYCLQCRHQLGGSTHKPYITIYYLLATNV